MNNPEQPDYSLPIGIGIFFIIIFIMFVTGNLQDGI
jgi:hypothetical protein